MLVLSHIRASIKEHKAEDGVANARITANNHRVLHLQASKLDQQGEIQILLEKRTSRMVSTVTRQLKGGPERGVGGEVGV